MQRLAAVAHKVRELADGLQDLRLPPPAVGREPVAMLLPGRIGLGGRQRAPVGEVEGQLLVAVDDRVGQITSLPAVLPDRLQGLFIVGPRRWKGRELGTSQYGPVVVQVQEVRRLAVGVMDPASALVSVGLARKLAHVQDSLRLVQEGREAGRQVTHGDLADHPVACPAPREDAAWSNGEEAGDGDRKKALHASRLSARPL